jgi:hypothetical protein
MALAFVDVKVGFVGRAAVVGAVGFLKLFWGGGGGWGERNQYVREKLGVKNIVQEIQQYQRKWLKHFEGIDTKRMLKQALKCQPKVTRNVGHPKERWEDQLHLGAKEQALRLTVRSS